MASTPVPDHTAVRVALWRAMHLSVDAAPPVFAAPAPTDRLAVAGLRLNFHPLDDSTPASLTSSVLDAFARTLAGLVSPLTR